MKGLRRTLLIGRLVARRPRTTVAAVAGTALAVPFLAGMTMGAVLAFFFDPRAGSARRSTLAGRVAGTVRRSSRRAERAARYAASTAKGKGEAAAQLGRGEREYDDNTLAEKVMTELFRDSEVKRRVNVSAENGVVVLRGEVPHPEDVEEVELRARRIEGVHEVRNLLHLPKTPAPTDVGRRRSRAGGAAER